MKKVFLSEHRSSFTLIELLVVIALISILAAMILFVGSFKNLLFIYQFHNITKA